MSIYDQKIFNSINSYRIFRDSDGSSLILGQTSKNAKEKTQYQQRELANANELLAKVHYYLSPKSLRTLYFSKMFESHLKRYSCQIWGQHI